MLPPELDAKVLQNFLRVETSMRSPHKGAYNFFAYYNDGGILDDYIRVVEWIRTEKEKLRKPYKKENYIKNKYGGCW
jgi:hypothetical protein